MACWRICALILVPAQKMARLFYFSFDRYGRKKTINLLREVCILVRKTVQQIADSRAQLADLTRVSVDLHKARTLFEELEREHHEEHSADPNDSPVPFEAVVNSAAEPAIVKAAAYNTRLSTTKASFASGHAFINGKHFDFTEVRNEATTSCIHCSLSALCLGFLAPSAK